MSVSQPNPEIGRYVDAGGYRTNVHDTGSGRAVLLLHGSGPGVSAWANWRLVIPTLAAEARVVAPDLLGFGYTDSPRDQAYTLDRWVAHAVDVLDALEIDNTDVVGNSFGGALALALAIRHPERIRRLVLMGSVGVPFQITPELDQVWGYQPSLENMKALMDIFAFDRSLVTDELARLRYQASIRDDVQSSFAAMFPAPRQRWVDAMSFDIAQLQAIPHETLIVHGREDRVIPLQTSITLLHSIPNAQLHVFGRCGHWTQIEQTQGFVRLVGRFISE